MQGFYSIALLITANIFMTFAWYGHLKFKQFKWLEGAGIAGTILVSWGIAFFEYCFQVPANKIGFVNNGGPFSLLQLKVIQEVITITVFVVFQSVVFQQQELKANHLVAFVFLVLAVYFTFRG